jgi:hypothetical protein
VTSLADITLRSYPHTIRLMGIFGLLGLGVLAISLPLQDSKVVLFYSFTYLAIVSGVTGNALRVRLSSSRAQTIPDYRGVHIAIALAWCALTLVVSAGISVFRGLPLMPLLLWLWSFGLLALFVGYALPAFALSHIRVAFIGVPVAGAAFALSAFGPINLLTARVGWGAQLLLVVVNAAASLLLVRRMSQLNEEAFEYVRTDPREMTQEIYEKYPGSPNASLDSIQGVMPSDLRSRLRHLEMGLFPGRPSFLKFAVGMTAAFVIIRFFSQRAADPLFAGAAISLPMTSLFVARQNVRRYLTLPLSRRELVAKGGGVILLAGLRMWCAVALAVAISGWSVPSPDLFLMSLATQLPIFGLLSLVMSVRTPWTKLQLLALLPASIALAFLIATVMQAPFPIQFVVSLIGGAATIRFSYYRWCNAELD